MALITFDDSLWPLVLLDAAGAPTDQQMEEYHARSRAYLARGEKYVTITNLDQFGMLTAPQRRRQADWLLENSDALRALLLGNATIIRSAPIRISLTLILPFKAMPMPYTVVPDMGSALRYVSHKLEEAGLGEQAERIRRQLALRAAQKPGP
jgi:hypothetical protein